SCCASSPKSSSTTCTTTHPPRPSWLSRCCSRPRSHWSPLTGAFAVTTGLTGGVHEQALQLDGRSALVLGYGRIGRRVARACAALGMEVRAVARREHADPGHRLHRPHELRSLLPSADVLMVCVPST